VILVLWLASHRQQGKAELLVKENGIIAGVAFAKMIFEFVDPTLQIEILLRTGVWFKRRCRFFMFLEVQSILKAERVVLNSKECLQ
jgi:nicotinate-nucleotide pyrophosphorylase (carboxylating)